MEQNCCEKFLLLFAKLVYCIEAPNDQKVSQWSYFEKIIHIISVIFDLVDLTNTLLDIVFVYGLYQSELTGLAIAMTFGIVLARLFARGGKKSLMHGGITYVPFFQKAEDYFSENKHKEKVVAYLYCLTFTELSIFFVEDATVILIWMFTGEFDPSDRWDLANSYVTLVTAFSSLLLLIVTIVYSINFKYCKVAMDNIQSKENFMDKFCSTFLMVLELFLKMLCAITYLLFFTLVLVGFFIFLIILNIYIISGQRGDWFVADFEMLVYIFLSFSWVISIYFAHKVVNICGCNKSKKKDMNANVGREYDDQDASVDC